MKKLLFIFLLNQSYISYGSTVGAPLEEAFSGVPLSSSGPRPVVPMGVGSEVGAPIGIDDGFRCPYFRVIDKPKTEIQNLLRVCHHQVVKNY